MRISDWSSGVCSSDLARRRRGRTGVARAQPGRRRPLRRTRRAQIGKHRGGATCACHGGHGCVSNSLILRFRAVSDPPFSARSCFAAFFHCSSTCLILLFILITNEFQETSMTCSRRGFLLTTSALALTTAFPGMLLAQEQPEVHTDAVQIGRASCRERVCQYV